MKPTDILSNEHRVIEQVLDCLDKMVTNSTEQQRLEEQPARQAIDFFRNFADRCHHGKEEAHLFPAMEAKGLSRDGGPTGVMLAEHDQGRQHVGAMEAAIDAASHGDEGALKEFTENAQQFTQLLRDHIEKEDRCLFAMATQALSDQEQCDLLMLFDQVDNEELGTGTHAKYLELADALSTRYGVERRPMSHGSGPCSCGRQ
jgi:hemerythrin-like domain-containing protein